MVRIVVQIAWSSDATSRRSSLAAPGVDVSAMSPTPEHRAHATPAVPMRYDEHVANPFVLGLASNFERALRLLEAALADCPPSCGRPTCGRTRPNGANASRRLARISAVVPRLPRAEHARLRPGRRARQPPQPFDEHTWSSPNRVFTKPELLGYVPHCRRRVHDALDELTEDKAALPVPVAHRHHPMTY